MDESLKQEEELQKKEEELHKIRLAF